MFLAILIVVYLLGIIGAVLAMSFVWAIADFPTIQTRQATIAVLVSVFWPIAVVVVFGVFLCCLRG